MLNTTPRTWVTSEVVTAAMMNAEIRDAINGLQAAWTSYTATWTATTTNPTLGNGTLLGAYTRFGKTVLYRIRITMGSTTTFGAGAYLFSPPLTPLVTSFAPAGTMTALDTSASSARTTHAYFNSATAIATHNDAGTNSGPTAPFTWATGDSITLAGMYEAA